MSPIRAYVVDDERLAVQRLSRLLDETGRVEIVGSTTDPEEALSFLSARAVDVLFLDVQMPGLTGFELLEQLERPPLVVFTTAYDAYALNAFDTTAVDYLLKPVEVDRLARALDRIERAGEGPRTDVRALARELATRLTPARKLERIASRVGDRTTLVDVARVTHFVAKDRLTFAVAGGREHVVDRTLAQLEERLDAHRFARIHRSTIVNCAFVQELYPAVDGGVLVRLKDDSRTELSVSRDRIRALKQKLGI
jgi:two-component system LytT family response regulator